MPRSLRSICTLLTSTLGALSAIPAQAASLQQVTSWGATGVPTYISMYEYVPAPLAASPPIVVAAHYCGGSASAFFGMASGIVAAADKYGFIMIFPQTTNPATSAKCWDVGSTKSLTHDGGGDTQAIAQMVKYEVSTRNANPNRVYIMGASSGAMLTEAMCAVYPDVFKAGAEFSGVPAGCWSAGWSAASNWGGTCASGNDTMTAQAWGDLVRKMYPGYTGPYPRMQLWHGTADTTINYNNQTEGIKEWTNVLGLSAAPNSTDTTSVSGFKIEKWQNSCGFTVLEAHTQNGGGHTTPIDANSVISFFGLDKSSAVDPGATACGDAGVSGSGGSTGSGGASGTGGAGGARDGGAGGATAGKDASGDSSTIGSSDAVGTGGASGTGGNTGTGGNSGSGGIVGSGGASAKGGSTASGGVGSGGTLASGGTTGSGGSSGTGGSSESGGSSGTGGNGSGGSSTSSGTTGGAVATGAGGNTVNSSTNSNGCSCTMGGKSSQPNGLITLLLFSALAVLARRTRGGRR